MRLKTKLPDIKYEFGDIRTTRKFAWWPKWVEDTLIWLEHYELLEKKVNTPRTMWIGKYPILVPWGWDFVDERLVKRGLPDFKNPPPPPLKR